MPQVVVEVSEEIAHRWGELAERSSLPVETWLGLCGIWGSALDLPMTRVVLRQPPAVRSRLGVAWEIGSFPDLTLPRRPQKSEVPMINKVILVGHVGRSPQLRSTASGAPMARFSLATERRWRDAAGDWREQTEWHSILCFGRCAELAQKNLASGRQIYLEGRIRTHCWEDAETSQTRYRTDVVCERFLQLGPRPPRVAPTVASEESDPLEGAEPEGS